jgi:hypothetical protein
MTRAPSSPQIPVLEGTEGIASVAVTHIGPPPFDLTPRSSIGIVQETRLIADFPIYPPPPPPLFPLIPTRPTPPGHPAGLAAAGWAVGALISARPRPPPAPEGRIDDPALAIRLDPHDWPKPPAPAPAPHVDYDSAWLIANA